MRYLRHTLVLSLLLAWSGAAFSQPIASVNLRNGPEILKAFRGVVAKSGDATVRVLVDGKEVAFGVVVDADGYILTKWSEINAKPDRITVKRKDGTVLDAEIVGVKDDAPKVGVTGAYDLALLRVNAKGLPTVKWHLSKDATVGRWVASVGTKEDPVAVGVVSVAARKFALGDQPPKLDNSKSGYLGVGLEDGMDGAKVNRVEPKSPAEKAGLMLNDIIYEVGGEKTPTSEALINTVGRYKANDEVAFKVRRGEEELDFKVKLAPRPKALQGNPQETMGTTLSKRRGGFPTIIQHDSGIRPEDCGSPLVDLDGKVVGLNIARAGRTESYAIPSDDIIPLIPDLKSGKFARTFADLLLHRVGGLTDKDAKDKKREKLGPDRFAKTEEVKLVADTTYVIDLRSSSKLDPYLILEDEDGKVLAEDDDTGGFPNARITFKAPADGTYRIICTTFNPNETGSFSLSVRKQNGATKEKAKEKEKS